MRMVLDWEEKSKKQFALKLDPIAKRLSMPDSEILQKLSSHLKEY